MRASAPGSGRRSSGCSRRAPASRGSDRGRQEPRLPAPRHAARRNHAGDLAAHLPHAGPGPRPPGARRRRHVPRLDPRAARDATAPRPARGRPPDPRLRRPRAARLPGVSRRSCGAWSARSSPWTRPTASANGATTSGLSTSQLGALLAELRGAARPRVHGHCDPDRPRRDPRPARPPRRHAADRPAASPVPNLALRAAEIDGRAGAAHRHVDALLAEALGAPGGRRHRHRLRGDPAGDRGRGGAPRGPPVGAPSRTTRASTGAQREAVQRAFAARRRSRSSSPPTPSAWASTGPTCAPSSTWPRPARSRPTTRRSGAPGATGGRPSGCSSSRRATSPLRRRLLERGSDGEAPDAAVRRAQVGPLPRAHALGRGRELPARRDSALLRRRGGDARRAADAATTCLALGEADAGRCRARRP